MKKLAFVLLAVIVVGILSIMLYKGCNNPAPTSKDKAIDSLLEKMKSDSIEGEARYIQDSGLIHNLTIALDTAITSLAKERQRFTIQGGRLLVTNKELRAALVAHDTASVYTRCDTLSRQIDSIAQVKWNVDRELDRQIVLNEQLRIADSTALAHCREDLKNTRSAASELVENYEAQRQADHAALKKAKRGKGLWGGIGAVAGAAIRSIFK
jgi:hypothetical protein